MSDQRPTVAEKRTWPEVAEGPQADSRRADHPARPIASQNRAYFDRAMIFRSCSDSNLQNSSA